MSGKIRLADIQVLLHSLPMSLGCQVSEERSSRLATARSDRESAVRNGSDSLNQAARQFRLAMIFQIPVGYEDDTGFHRGVQRVQEAVPDSPPEMILTDKYEF